jgi:phosphate transport system substrate-binding protein
MKVRTMPRSLSVRGIVLTASAAMGVLALAACTPPLPPDVLAAQAESQITCQSGEVQVAVPVGFTGAMDSVGLALSGVCPEQTVLEVPEEQAAPVRLVGHAPTTAEVEAFAAASCPAGTPIVVPAFAYPVTLAYNVIGLEGVVMTPEIVAGILDGSITSWEDPAILALNEGFDFTGLPEFAVMSVETDQPSVEAMTTWLTEEAPEAWPAGVTGTLPGTQTFPTEADLLAEMTLADSTVAVLPIFTAINNALASANLTVTLEDGSQAVITSDDVQGYKIGSGATTVTTDAAGSMFASPSVGGIPDPAVFDLSQSKVVLSEGQPLAGWPVNAYAHLIVCDDPADPKALSFAQYLVRLAGQGSLEGFGVTPLPEPIRFQTFTPLKVTVDPNAIVESTPADDAAAETPAEESPAA